MWQHTQLTGTNSRTFGRIVPFLARVSFVPHQVAKIYAATLPGPNPGADAQQLAGDHTQVTTPVPIPNTAVKNLGPMVVRPARE